MHFSTNADKSDATSQYQCITHNDVESFVKGKKLMMKWWSNQWDGVNWGFLYFTVHGKCMGLDFGVRVHPLLEHVVDSAKITQYTVIRWFCSSRSGGKCMGLDFWVRVHPLLEHVVDSAKITQYTVIRRFCSYGSGGVLVSTVGVLVSTICILHANA
jgi:hypothetical protein